MSSTVARGRHGWSLRRRVGATFWTLAALLAVLAVLVVIALLQYVGAGNSVIDRWQPAVSRSQDLLSDLLNQETGVRGYALAGTAASLAPYTTSVGEQQADTAALRGYLHGREELRTAVTAFTTAATAWHATVAQPLINEVRAHGPAAPSVIDSAAATQAFDLVRARAAALTTDLSAQSQHARGERHSAALLLEITLGVTGALFLGAGLGVLRGLRRWVLHPVDQLASQTRLVASGDPRRQIVPLGPPEVFDLGADVETMRERIADELDRLGVAHDELARRSEDLARSNADLEQFAYVASHDLSEPLRKIANFCQLLERQYSDQLDDKARQYIDFAVDGARRMQTQINDLLAFSRVGRTSDAFVPVALGDAVDAALANLDSAVTESSAVVERGELPTVSGDLSLLTALLQNLIGNAIKYRAAAAPRVLVAADPLDGGGWLVTVADNGIGVDRQYAERIFAIFQRLHLRDEYGGTGIGLALSRKIVEFHGGRIWLDTAATATGATFRFTLAEGSPRVR